MYMLKNFPSASQSLKGESVSSAVRKMRIKPSPEHNELFCGPHGQARAGNKSGKHGCAFEASLSGKLTDTQHLGHREGNLDSGSESLESRTAMKIDCQIKLATVTRSKHPQCSM
jgi:hypothetical protein